MKKNILINGLISGIIVSILMILSINYFSFCAGNVDYGTSMLIGYASMLLAFSLIFIGIRNYRDLYNGGVISFGKAFKIGILIALISSTIYVIAWLITYYNFMPDFLEKFTKHSIEELKASGASQATIDEKTKEMEGYAPIFKNPLLHGLVTYTEILPIGLLVTLISALILKRKTPNQIPA
jgi:hypothetical protein